MPKRRILIILFPVAAAAIMGLVLVLTCEREPEYEGKKLSEWVELNSRAPGTRWEYKMSDGRTRWTGEADIPHVTELLNRQKGFAGPIRAAGVLASLGKAGLPSLFGALTNKQSDLGLKETILWHLEEQGTNARSAVPILQSLLTDTNAGLRTAASKALQVIDHGWEPNNRTV